MDATDGGREQRRTGLFGLIFLAIALLVGIDLAADARVGSTLRHLLMEGGIFVLAAWGGGWMLRQNRRLAREAAVLTRDLATLRVAAEAWRREAGDLLAGLGAAMDHQFARWGLSAAEQEVALLLLKGLSHKEIGECRGVGEATVRQQARNLYRKAGLAGRHELAAFFLEDLLAPRGGRSEEA